MKQVKQLRHYYRIFRSNYPDLASIFNSSATTDFIVATWEWKCEGFKKTESLQPTTACSQAWKNLAQRDYVAHGDPQQQVLALLPFMLALHSWLCCKLDEGSSRDSLWWQCYCKPSKRGTEAGALDGATVQQARKEHGEAPPLNSLPVAALGTFPALFFILTSSH